MLCAHDNFISCFGITGVFMDDAIQAMASSFCSESALCSAPEVLWLHRKVP